MNTTPAKSTLREVLGHGGHQIYADGGAVKQTDGRRPVKECSHCLGKVVFVQSKAGKWYLADVFPYGGESERYYYDKSAPHFKSCERRADLTKRLVEGLKASEPTT